MNVKQAVTENKTSLGIELGSTRIKAVLIDEDFSLIASGSHEWENKLENGFWTYHLDDVWKGLQSCFNNLAVEIKNRCDLVLSSAGAIGISAMMHGYLAFDKNGNLLAPFRTWRNTTTGKAASVLTKEFNFNIPQRWSIAHLYQAILNGEEHVKDIDYLTTLAGFVHWRLTGRKVLGLNDVSGMFPVDSASNSYNAAMLKQFDKLAAGSGLAFSVEKILPKILAAGENAGTLTEEGAKLLDPNGNIKAGVPFCPPEGDAGTGMVATGAVTERTGNISAGTSIFGVIVLEKELSKVYTEIDIMVTPAGKPAAVVHGNNCTGDIDAWVRLFHEAAELTGAKISKARLYDMLYEKALEADDDCGELLSNNYYSGEHITGFEEGRPLLVRKPDSKFTLANLMRTVLYTSMGALKYGMNILVEQEKVKIDSILGHGGLFKTKGVGQRMMAAAINAPVSVAEESAGEGGAWGIALLAAFTRQNGQSSLESFLAEKVFKGKTGAQINPDPKDVESFNGFMRRYAAGLKIEKAAVENFK
jgi:sugar (pentulose or hexulose) kinase